VKLTSYKTHLIGNKLTTYKLEIDDAINLFLDFGSTEMNQGDFLRKTIIILTHEHLDHWDGIVKKIDLLHTNKSKIEIYSTKTTKLLIQALFENYYRSDFKELTPSKVNQITDLLSSINVLFYQVKVMINENLSIELFPSGHTYGGSMVYVSSSEKSILYTSDVDFVKGDSSRQYYFPFYNPSYPVDVLLLDATATFRNYKSLALKEFMEATERIKDLEIKVVPEKSLIFARILNEQQNRKVTIAYDLWWYYKILEEMGYSPFAIDQISFDDKTLEMNLDERTAKVSSIAGRPKDHKIGLHIGLNDAIDFVDKLREISDTNVYLTHYDWNRSSEIIYLADELGYHVLHEGTLKL
jgi:phosphoribosyl 1,2-cyclic phosphodiesterase